MNYTDEQIRILAQSYLNIFQPGRVFPGTWSDDYTCDCGGRSRTAPNPRWSDVEHTEDCPWVIANKIVEG